jgi:hypothetical protein
MKAQMTDIWFRNPGTTLDLLASEGVSRITWSRFYLARRKADGINAVRLHYMHSSIRPKIMLIGIQGSSEYTVMSNLDNPIAVYPTWSGREDSFSDLLDLIEHPWGEDMNKCSDLSTPSSLRPIFGQRHQVVITNPPPSTTGKGKRFWLDVARVQDDYPEVDFFINGTGNMSVLLGMGFPQADVGMNDIGDPNDTVWLPNGLRIELKRGEINRLIQWKDWIQTMGFTVDEVVKDQSARYRLRIRSVRWASKHWRNNYKFSNSIYAELQPNLSDDEYRRNKKGIFTFRRKQWTTQEGDKVLCDRCSIAPNCKVFRTGSICGLKESKMSELEKFFQSRHAGKIIDGLAEITRLQARRLENSIDNEVIAGEVDPDITRQMNSLFANGVKLAKLVDPDLNGKGTNVQVNVGVSGGSTAQISTSNPKELIAGVVAALEDQGIPREQITPKMIQGVLSGMSSSSPQAAIEGAAAQHEQQVQKLTVEDVTETANSDVLEGEFVALKPEDTKPMSLFPLMMPPVR